MEKQLNLFFGFLENEKKVSSNTLQSYKRDLKQFEKYIEQSAKDYSKITDEGIKDYIEYYNNYRYQWNLKKMTPVLYKNHLLKESA